MANEPVISPGVVDFDPPPPITFCSLVLEQSFYHGTSRIWPYHWPGRRDRHRHAVLWCGRHKAWCL